MSATNLMQLLAVYLGKMYPWKNVSNNKMTTDRVYSLYQIMVIQLRKDYCWLLDICWIILCDNLELKNIDIIDARNTKKRLEFKSQRGPMTVLCKSFFGVHKVCDSLHQCAHDLYTQVSLICMISSLCALHPH